eukprot:Em0001g801a
MSSKVVLVSYMERNKKFTIPASKEQSDVEFLKKEFFTAFGIRRTQDHTVTLQSFDDEFGEFVDTKDDALFVNKTKLKAILVRQSETNSKLWDAEIESSRSTSELQSFTSSPTSSIRAWSPSVSDIETRATSPSISDIQIRATSPSTSASTSFIPFSQEGAIVQTLCDRFKELRRPLRTTVTPFQKTDHHPKKQKDSKAQTPAMAILCKPPALPPGEDETSLNRHIKILSTEYTKTKKGRGNHQLVTSLMEKTFSVRRADVLKSEEFNLHMILVKYPYLQCSDHLFMEMERIIAGAGSDVTHASFSDSWNKLWTPRIMTQARSESSSNTRLRTVLESMEISFESNASLPVYGLVLLPYMLRDSRFVPDYKIVLHCIPVSSNVEQEIQQKKQNEPYLLCYGGVTKPEQVYLVIDLHYWVQIYVQVFGVLTTLAVQADQATVSGSFHGSFDFIEH